MDHIDYGTHIACRTDRLGREAEARQLVGSGARVPRHRHTDRSPVGRTAAALVGIALLVGAIAGHGVHRPVTWTPPADGRVPLRRSHVPRPGLQVRRG